MTARPGRSRAPDRGEDPLAADRRTLVVAALAMLGLVAVGVVSSAVFAESACARIEPGSLAPAAAVAGPADLAELPYASAPDLGAEFAELTAVLGPITGVAAVDAAAELAGVPEGVAALGSVTSLLSAAGDEMVARVAVGDGRVVGSGTTLYALAATNPLTGQVDALQPLDATLGGLTCVDTATVGTPLAFHLDAGDGQLLLLRVDEDGGDPVLELRDPVAGRLWAPRLDLAAGSPGVLGELVDARLGPSTVLVARPAVPGAPRPVLTSYARADGGLRWERSADELGLRTDGSSARLVEVLALDDGLAVLAVTPDAVEPEPGAVTPTRLLGLDPEDGSLRWDLTLAAGEEVLAAATADRRAWFVLDRPGARRLAVVDPGGAGLERVSELPAAPARPTLAPQADGGVLLAAGGTVRLVPGDLAGDGAAVTIGVEVLDVLVHPAGTSLLVGMPASSEQRMVVTYGR